MLIVTTSCIVTCAASNVLALSESAITGNNKDVGLVVDNDNLIRGVFAEAVKDRLEYSVAALQGNQTTLQLVRTSLDES